MASEDNKLGPYIQKLMTTIIDSEQEEFVKNLAISELSRINADVNEFILKHKTKEEKPKTAKKELLNEEKNDGK